MVNPIFRPLLPQKVESFRQAKSALCRDFFAYFNEIYPRKNILTFWESARKFWKRRGLLVHLWKAGLLDFTDDERIFLRTHSLENSVTYLGN